MSEIAVNGIRFNYVDSGAAHAGTILMSNSLASNLSMWDPQVGALRDQGWRVIRYDNRGHGGTAPSPGPVSMEMLADDAIGLMDALELETAHFCGLSLGGMVGQMAAVRHPGRLATLMLCDTAAHMGPPDLWNDRIAAVRAGGMASVVDATLGRWFSEAGRARLPAAVSAVREGILGTTAAGFVAAAEAIRDMDQRESIRSIAIPTHVVVGESDPATPVAVARLIHERIQGSALTVIPQAAHMVNIEQSGRFNEVLLAFLAAHT